MTDKEEMPKAAVSVDDRTIGGRDETSDGQTAVSAGDAGKREAPVLDGSRPKAAREPTDMTRSNQARPRKVRGIPGWKNIAKATGIGVGETTDDETQRPPVTDPKATGPHAGQVAEVDSYGNTTYHDPYTYSDSTPKTWTGGEREQTETDDTEEQTETDDTEEQTETDDREEQTETGDREEQTETGDREVHTDPKEVGTITENPQQTWRDTHPGLSKYMDQFNASGARTAGGNAPAVFGIAGNVVDTAARAFKLLSSMVTGALKNPRNMMGNFINTMEGAHKIADNSINNVRQTLGLPADANGEIMTDAVGTIKGAKYVRDKEQMNEAQDRYNQNVMEALEYALGTTGLTPEEAVKRLPAEMSKMNADKLRRFSDKFNELAKDHLQEFLDAGVRTPAADAAMQMYQHTLEAQSRYLSGDMREMQNNINRRTAAAQRDRAKLAFDMIRNRKERKRIREEWLNDTQATDDVRSERSILHSAIGDDVFKYIDENTGDVQYTPALLYRLGNNKNFQRAYENALSKQQKVGNKVPLTADEKAAVKLHDMIKDDRDMFVNNWQNDMSVSDVERESRRALYGLFKDRALDYTDANGNVRYTPDLMRKIKRRNDYQSALKSAKIKEMKRIGMDKWSEQERSAYRFDEMMKKEERSYLDKWTSGGYTPAEQHERDFIRSVVNNDDWLINHLDDRGNVIFDKKLRKKVLNKLEENGRMGQIEAKLGTGGVSSLTTDEFAEYSLYNRMQKEMGMYNINAWATNTRLSDAERAQRQTIRKILGDKRLRNRIDPNTGNLTYTRSDRQTVLRGLSDEIHEIKAKSMLGRPLSTEERAKLDLYNSLSNMGYNEVQTWMGQGGAEESLRRGYIQKILGNERLSRLIDDHGNLELNTSARNTLLRELAPEYYNAKNHRDRVNAGTATTPLTDQENAVLSLYDRLQYEKQGPYMRQWTTDHTISDGERHIRGIMYDVFGDKLRQHIDDTGDVNLTDAQTRRLKKELEEKYYPAIKEKMDKAAYGKKGGPYIPTDEEKAVLDTIKALDENKGYINDWLYEKVRRKERISRQLARRYIPDDKVLKECIGKDRKMDYTDKGTRIALKNMKKDYERAIAAKKAGKATSEQNQIIKMHDDMIYQDNKAVRDWVSGGSTFIENKQREVLHDVFGDKGLSKIIDPMTGTVSSDVQTLNTIRSRLTSRIQAAEAKPAGLRTVEDRAASQMYNYVLNRLREVNDAESIKKRVGNLREGINRAGGDPSLLGDDGDLSGNQHLSAFEKVNARAYAANKHIIEDFGDDDGLILRIDTLRAMRDTARTDMLDFYQSGFYDNDADFNRLSDREKAKAVLDWNTYTVTQNRLTVQSYRNRIENAKNLSADEKTELISGLMRAYDSDTTTRPIRRGQLRDNLTLSDCRDNSDMEEAFLNIEDALEDAE